MTKSIKPDLLSRYMNQKYELYLIINPDLKSEQIKKEIKSITDTLNKLKAENLAVEEEGVKKLAYPINKKRSGFYVLINFELDIENSGKVNTLDKQLNLNANAWRYLLLNITKDLSLKESEKINQTEIQTHLDYNSGTKNKKDFINFLGIKYIDYKNIDLIKQYQSPYAKIFKRTRTGNTAKTQRKITKAIKRARHMALLPFTPIHN